MSQEDPRVVVVDDVEANVVLLRRLLAAFGITSVWSTSDAREALPLVLEVEPDLVLLDLHMPGTSGVEVLAALRTHVPSEDFLPVIVLTADASSQAMQAALAAGANDLVTKPFDRFEIDLRIRNLLRTRWLYLRLREHTTSLEDSLRAQLDHEQALADQRNAALDRVHGVLAGEGLTMHFQPIVCLLHGDVLGVEALARFAGPPARTPDLWFAEAAGVDLGAALELHAVRQALATLPALPESVYVSVNLSAEAVLSPAVVELLTGVDARRVVVELTEHAQVSDYGELLSRLDLLRGQGVRLAVDDTGAGFASLRHILRLRPDLIKLDLDLTRGIDQDPARRALAQALVAFAGELGAGVVAEGVETAEELAVLRDLGADAGQGYFLGRPHPLPLRPVEPAAQRALGLVDEVGTRPRGGAGA